MKKIKLDKYEQDIENNLDEYLETSNDGNLKSLLENAAISHLNSKKSITIRLSNNDIEAMKIKASKMGVPYQTYINILIHKDAISI